MPMVTERRCSSILRHKLWAIVLFGGFAGCRLQVSNWGEDCLDSYPGWVKCCEPFGRPDDGICCRFGQHAVHDIDHPDWKTCVFDEEPHGDAGACQEVIADGEADAGADAP